MGCIDLFIVIQSQFIPLKLKKKITLKVSGFTFGILPDLRMGCHSLATYSVHAETDNLF